MLSSLGGRPFGSAGVAVAIGGKLCSRQSLRAGVARDWLCQKAERVRARPAYTFRAALLTLFSHALASYQTCQV